MNIILNVLGLLGPFSIVITLIVIALLSQRLGAVTRRAPIYRWFYVSAALIAISIFFRLLSMGVAVADGQSSLLYDLPLTAGLALAVIIAWRYWSWLLSERGKRA